MVLIYAINKDLLQFVTKRELFKKLTFKASSVLSINQKKLFQMFKTRTLLSTCQSLNFLTIVQAKSLKNEFQSNFLKTDESFFFFLFDDS